MIFDTSWSKLRRILELCSASQLVTGGLGVTLAQKKTLQGLAFQSLSQWRLLRRKSLALSILLRQSNKRNYYTMMLSHTVFSTLRMHQTSRVSRKAKFGSLEAKKDVQLDHNYDVRSKTNETQKWCKKEFTDHLICFLIAEQFPIQSYSNWLMKRQD